MGGLVARSYIQGLQYDSDQGWHVDREKYGQDISKLLMLGTPNHGAFIAFRIFYADVRDEEATIFGRINADDGAPAYAQMTPGSDFMYQLNSVPPEPLYNEAETARTYLVVAGTDEGRPDAHDEINGQQDGFVAISSASMLDDGVPLTTIDLRHSHVKYALANDETTSAEAIAFLKGDNYTPSLEKPQSGNITSENEGILTLRLNVDGVENWSIDQDKKRLLVRSFGDNIGVFNNSEAGITYDYSGRLQRIEDRSEKENRFFYINGFNLNDIGLGAPSSEQYNMYLCSSVDSDQCSPYGVFRSIPFKGLQSTMAEINLSKGQLAILNSANFIVDCTVAECEQSQSTIASKSVSSSQYRVDAATEEVVFHLTSPDGFDASDMDLVTPGGQRISPSDAQSDPNLEFLEDPETGFAFYYVNNPARGVWQVEYNASIANANLAAPVLGTVNLDVTFARERYNVGQLVEFDVALSGTALTGPEAEASLTVVTDDDQVVDLGPVPLGEGSQGTWRGDFTATQAGRYRLTIDVEGTLESEPVSRRTFATVAISDDSPASCVASGFTESLNNEARRIEIAINDPEGIDTFSFVGPDPNSDGVLPFLQNLNVQLISADGAGVERVIQDANNPNYDVYWQSTDAENPPRQVTMHLTQADPEIPEAGYFLQVVNGCGTKTIIDPPRDFAVQTPESFALDSNYPNPFSGATTIQFALPQSEQVEVTVYDALGRRVATLVDQELPAGRHEVTWDGRTLSSPLSSGVYFYRLQAGDFTATRRMTLVR
jgi:hypothetical protein